MFHVISLLLRIEFFKKFSQNDCLATFELFRMFKENLTLRNVVSYIIFEPCFFAIFPCVSHDIS